MGGRRLKVAKKVVLTFPKHTWDKPIIYTLHSRHHLMFNILKAKITPNEEGLMVLELIGEEDDFNKGMEFLKEIGVGVRFLAADVERDDEKCTHCGACISVCPTEALKLDRETMMVIFDKEKCVGCELCVPVCPFKALRIKI